MINNSIICKRINCNEKEKTINSRRYDNNCSNFSKLVVFSLLSILLAVLLMSNINSLGVTPGRTTIDYQNGLEKEVSFSVLNNEHKNMQVLLTVQGELNGSVTLYDSLIEFLPSEESKQFKYKINLNSDIEKIPGLHSAEIVALEVPKADEGGTYVGATVAVVSQLYIYVSYPGKYVEADLNVLNAEQNS